MKEPKPNVFTQVFNKERERGPQEGSDAERPAKKEPFAIKVDPELLERLRRAAYWERTTVTALFEQGAAELLDQMEKQRGEPFEPRPKNAR